MAKRKLVSNDIQGILKTLQSDEVDDILSLSRRRELTNAAEQLDQHTRDYVQYGRRHTDAVFESLNEVVGGLVGVLKDMNDETKAVKPSPQPVAPVSAAPEQVRPNDFPGQIAATLARLEERLTTTASEIGALIESAKQLHPPSQRL